ncbi:SDR family oxidoreductase [Aurantiacibacter rhizosphaerae]|uniref:SDR family NAD(P)-dependent oxidoreductase n=1 Tax=Aurantiacibacter rhizosphaerae TaxID=2691582 RepID=A0A844XEG7_9SPHN|nr:SDR family oxidoreductase [Aurantiacibacter rhizosphaerae]MWV28062.1 SDR family NAD(P)-dependent oxidoreductase [Aurantiacibacter rhizosphaerae]
MSILQGRVAVVTGASSGIGEACAIEFVNKGAKVVLAARRQERLDTLVKKIEGMGGEAMAVVTDVTDEADIENLMASGAEQFGSIDVLINNAGIAENTPVAETSLEHWHKVIDTNLTSAFLCAKHAWPHFMNGGHGRIVNIGSISAKVPRSECPSYTASKFGLQGLTHALAVDGRDHNIAVSIFHPGIVATEIMPGSVKLPDNFAASPEEIAEVIVHMCDMPDYLNFYEALVVQNKLPFLGRG